MRQQQKLDIQHELMLTKEKRLEVSSTFAVNNARLWIHLNHWGETSLGNTERRMKWLIYRLLLKVLRDAEKLHAVEAKVRSLRSHREAVEEQENRNAMLRVELNRLAGLFRQKQTDLNALVQRVEVSLFLYLDCSDLMGSTRDRSAYLGIWNNFVCKCGKCAKGASSGHVPSMGGLRKCGICNAYY